MKHQQEQQWEDQDHEDEDHLPKWYSDKDESPKGASSSKDETSKSAKSEELGSSPFSVVGEDSSISTKDLLHMMMKQHERTLERVLEATTPKKSSSKEEHHQEIINQLEDQKVKPHNSLKNLVKYPMGMRP